MQENTDQKKLRIWTFHAVLRIYNSEMNLEIDCWEEEESLKPSFPQTNTDKK